MARRILIFALAAATVFELGLSMGAFFTPNVVLAAFKVGVSTDTLFLANVVAWLLLGVTLVVALALKWVLVDNRAGWSLSFVLGAWWVAIGVGLYLRFGLIDNLVIDSLKGAIIFAAAWKSRPSAA